VDFFGTYDNTFGTTPASGPTTLPTPSALAAAFVVWFNTLVSGGNVYPFSVAVNAGNPAQVDFTAKTTTGYANVDGSKGNALSISGQLVAKFFGFMPATTGQPFTDVPPVDPINSHQNYNPFTSSNLQITITQPSGGVDGGQILYSSSQIQQLTYETIGSSLFLAGYPAGYILQFDSLTNRFSVLTNYQGARVLSKLTGHLISVGLINSANQVETNPHLWLNWSAPGKFAIWNALDSAGLVTGAGGGQLADISDMLTGLVISNSIAFILRADGLSYATPLGSGADPFDISHVALAKDAQGCKSTSLWCQYDQVGFYVGDSQVYLLNQSPQAVGKKIADLLFQRLIQLSSSTVPFQDYFYAQTNTVPAIFSMNNMVSTMFAINLFKYFFMYDPGTDVWMKLSVADATFLGSAVQGNWAILKLVSLPMNGTTGFGGSYQVKDLYLYGQFDRFHNVSPDLGFKFDAPVLYKLSNTISQYVDAYVIFPEEEISAGRDITIDALYVIMSGVPGAQVIFSVSGYQNNPSVFTQNAMTSTITLDAASSPDLSIEYQVFDVSGGAITLKAPKLSITVPAQVVSPTPPASTYPFNSNPQFKITKISMFGSYDPNQRPV
jgi:hypothetical protein